MLDEVVGRMRNESDQRAVSPDDPEEIAAALRSAEPTTRRRAVDAFGALVRTDPGAAADHTDVVAERLTDESVVVARGAAEALVPIAREHPEALLDRIDTVVEVVAADAIELSLSGAELLSSLAVEHPERVAESADRLVEILAADEVPTPGTEVPETVDRTEARQILRDVQRESHERRQYVRRTAANVVVAVVEDDPTHLRDVDALATLLDDSDPGVVGPALDALGTVAASDPDAVRPALDGICECLDQDVTAVRARAVRALGHLGDESAVAPLRRVATGDDDEDVAELAAETADFLAGE